VQLVPEKASAHLIYYEDKNKIIPPDVVWPEWVSDVPAAATQIRAGDPVCTIMASADEASEAQLMARQRAEWLKDLLN
jgi:predicted ATP-grasp superfamily ATP-dependent carboligase